MFCCDDCKHNFFEPELILYQDSDAYISQYILVCPRCFGSNFFNLKKGSDSLWQEEKRKFWR